MAADFNLPSLEKAYVEEIRKNLTKNVMKAIEEEIADSIAEATKSLEAVMQKRMDETSMSAEYIVKVFFRNEELKNKDNN